MAEPFSVRRDEISFLMALCNVYLVFSREVNSYISRWCRTKTLLDGGEGGGVEVVAIRNPKD